MKLKECFNCKSKLPLFCFQKIKQGYRRDDWLGRVINCKKCTIKKSFKIGGIFKRVGKDYVFTPMSKKEIVKSIIFDRSKVI